MAVPKKKSSSSRGGHRRSHDSIATPHLAVCSNCQEMRPSHRVCPACGWYDGREVVQVEE
ncbi:MAG: 50S ribosomal protein L32 [Magnetococcales bacterium]|nr:50S ribosomal protein L32 [Magnetococcales bacterium]MBF0584563.1 50S ribosomal protein L32 [Magnetococcales bacterium]